MKLLIYKNLLDYYFEIKNIDIHKSVYSFYYINKLNIEYFAYEYNIGYVIYICTKKLRLITIRYLELSKYTENYCYFNIGILKPIKLDNIDSLYNFDLLSFI